jgi:hypothetical protein
MINALDPDRMTATERLDEMADILAAGLLRLRKRCSSNSNDLREVCLDFNANQSMHGQSLNGHGESR